VGSWLAALQVGTQQSETVRLNSLSDVFGQWLWLAALQVGTQQSEAVCLNSLAEVFGRWGRGLQRCKPARNNPKRCI